MEILIINIYQGNKTSFWNAASTVVVKDFCVCVVSNNVVLNGLKPMVLVQIADALFCLSPRGIFIWKKPLIPEWPQPFWNISRKSQVWWGACHSLRQVLCGKWKKKSLKTVFTTVRLPRNLLIFTFFTFESFATLRNMIFV